MAHIAKFVRTAGKYLGRGALGLLALALLACLLGVIGTLVPNPPPRTFDGPASARLLVASNTIHTDLAIAITPQTLASFPFLAESGLPVDDPGARWLLFGWGGRSFYLETPTLADIRPGPAFRALTIDSSVMHVAVIGDVIEPDPAIMAFDLSDEALAALLAAIADGFARDGDGAVQPIAGYSFGSADRFYAANGAFNALLGCNTWTARMLRAAGLTTGLWNPIPSSLTASLQFFNRGPTN